MRASAATAIQPRRRFPIWWGLLALAVAAVGIWGSVSRPWETKPVRVVTETVSSGPAQRVLAINGRIAPEMQVDVSSTVGGRVQSVLVQEGDAVRSGDLLAALDDEQQQAVVAQAEAALAGAKAALQQAKVEFERAKALGETTSRKSLDAAQLAVQTAQNDVGQLSAARNRAMSLLTEYRIEAPFDGTVLVRDVDPGQVVNSSTVLFSIADLAHLRAEANVDELYTSEIRRGLKARLQPFGYNRTLEGEVSTISPTVDSNTGGRLVRVAIADTQAWRCPSGLRSTSISSWRTRLRRSRFPAAPLSMRLLRRPCLSSPAVKQSTGRSNSSTGHPRD